MFSGNRVKMDVIRVNIFSDHIRSQEADYVQTKAKIMMNQKNQVLILVSDKFKEFAKNSGVIIYSDLIEKLHAGEIDAEVIIIGQGLGVGGVENLTQAIEHSPYKDRISLVSPGEVMVESDLVHKRKTKNVIVSTPKKLHKNVFTAVLLLDESCDEMGDHVTGQHVQGTLLIEAARQMMMAVVEMEAFTPESRGKCSYVLRQINVNYSRYLFPVEAQMLCTVDELDVDAKGVLSTELTVEVYQNDELVCALQCKATGYPKQKLQALEAREAKKCLRNLQNRWMDQIEGSVTESYV